MERSRTEPADLGPWLRTRSLGRSLVYHEHIGSTQDEARALAVAGAPHGQVVWAGTQTAGRGRLQRGWYSPAGAGLWFSVVLRPGAPAPAMSALPLVMGVAVASALDLLAPGRVRLKWPNDVLLDGRKVAGILVDATVAGGRLDDAVVGVGVNLRQPPGGFPDEIAATAAAMADATGTPPSPPRTLAAILGEMEEVYEVLLATGPGSARARWLQLSDTIGKEVVAHTAAGEVRGIAEDLDEAGNLVVRSGSKAVTVAYGEVQHLR